MTQLQLEAIVQKAALGNNDALIQLCTSITKSVIFRINRVLHNASDAEDVAQEVLLRVCKNIRSLKNPSHFRVWLNKITMNETYRHLEKNSKQGSLYGGGVLDIDDYHEVLDDVDEDFIPHDFAIRSDDCKRIMKIVQKLPQRQLQAVLLHYYDGLSVTETAIAMDVSKPTVSQYLSLAKEKIRNDLQKMIHADEKVFSGKLASGYFA